MQNARKQGGKGRRRRINVVWFKHTDLRVHDHAPLKAAHSCRDVPVLHLFVFDPFWFRQKTPICGFPKTGLGRAQFQIEAVRDLEKRLFDVSGHRLCVSANLGAREVFQKIVEQFEVSSVFAFHEICSEELKIQRQVETVVKSQGGLLSLFWGFELYHIDDLPFSPEQPGSRGAFKSYTAFRKRVEEGTDESNFTEIKTVATSTGKERGVQIRRSSENDVEAFLPPDTHGVVWVQSAVSLSRGAHQFASPSAEGSSSGSLLDGITAEALLGIEEESGEKMENRQKDPRAECDFKGGETEALRRLHTFLWGEDSLALEYVGATMTTDPAKSACRDKAMSKLSPYLAHGCLSPRKLYEEIKKYEASVKEGLRKNKKTYWIVHELIWRDFVRFGAMHFGDKIFKLGGIFPSTQGFRGWAWRWSRDRDLFFRWKEGKTGFPFIDCFLRELEATGYCNHMGRECSGWFLCREMGVDWRMGAEWFESVLLDYEPTANWLNWVYRCVPAADGSNIPPAISGEGHILTLQILAWGAQHDPDGVWVRRWIPELQGVAGLLSLSPAGRVGGTSSVGSLVREPWRLMGTFWDEDVETGGSRVVLSDEMLSVSESMGFSRERVERAVAKALRETGDDWVDTDVVVALLVEEGEEGAGENTSDGGQMEGQKREDGKRQQEPDDPKETRTFVYGRDYPKPVVRPMCLTNTEDIEENARFAQAQNAAWVEKLRRSLEMVREGGDLSTLGRVRLKGSTGIGGPQASKLAKEREEERGKSVLVQETEKTENAIQLSEKGAAGSGSQKQGGGGQQGNRSRRWKKT